MRPNPTAQADYGLLFDLRRSVRYHDRRRAWFESLYRLTGVTAILIGAAIFIPVRPWMAAQLIIAGLLLGGVALGFASSAALHKALRIRFIGLEAEMLANPAANHHIARLVIEKDEPPIYRALDLLCHNEQLRAEAHPAIADYLVTVPLYQRLTCHLFRWPDAAA